MGSIMRFLFGFSHPGDANPMIDNPYAKACTPDDLIVAHLLESFAKHMKDWKCTSDRDSRWSPREMVLTNRQTGFVIVSKYKHKNKDRYGEDNTNSPKIYEPCVVKRGVWTDYAMSTFKVTTEVTLSDKASVVLRNEYNRLKAVFDKAEAVAFEARKTMEDNEKKWNLAESLLGMKRNEFGALVPVRAAEDCQNCGSVGGAAACDCY